MRARAKSTSTEPSLPQPCRFPTNKISASYTMREVEFGPRSLGEPPSLMQLVPQRQHGSFRLCGHRPTLGAEISGASVEEFHGTRLQVVHRARHFDRALRFQFSKDGTLLSDSSNGHLDVLSRDSIDEAVVELAEASAQAYLVASRSALNISRAAAPGAKRPFARKQHQIRDNQSEFDA